ncbi:MAG: hypothetical protein A2498_07085 [Lentisphaerae bacterium RIFOXYC12_FULL_60_16]|nr:MAG: hypothetical protein A2498_07085 [Lentisphaerae bacterium RIFOXYC12_FULL_60_16]OGV72499.1 MAG: hypothetical protein A2269_01295 [Lentisphaerae bacterium RIFOXYA12_FULL_60_10]OGV78927.1 MAG: hypothetical protein A2340_03260 [Lentisphaerae bacterium RIFOXYB12_FULL_60_10]
MTPAIDISLNFMPAFYTKHTGITYGEAYYFDPAYRARVERTEALFLHECLGPYGAGCASPVPSANLFIQPVDLIMRTQGADWRLPDDATLESWGKPWAELTPAEIARIDPAASAHHPIIDRILDQYREMKKLYGDRADIFGTRSGTMNIHTPFTTAHQLCGESLFIRMMETPYDARQILYKVWAIYQAIFARICQATGAGLERINLGDCSASLLSEATYRDGVLPVNQSIASTFHSVSYHSCGPSTHLLKAFREIPSLSAIELGPGTDLNLGTVLMPGCAMRPLVDPTVIREGSTDQVHDLTVSMLHSTARAPAVTLCAWSFDRDTPIENVATLYRTVEQARK